MANTSRSSADPKVTKRELSGFSCSSAVLCRAPSRKIHCANGTGNFTVPTALATSKPPRISIALCLTVKIFRDWRIRLHIITGCCFVPLMAYLFIESPSCFSTRVTKGSYGPFLGGTGRRGSGFPASTSSGFS